MPHDPRARIVSVGTDWNYTNDPSYGPGAIREVVYEDGTIERRWFALGSVPEGQEGDPNAGHLISETVAPQIASSWRSSHPEDRDKTPPAQTPEQQRAAQLENEARERKAAQDKQADDEARANQAQTGYYETHQQRAEREYRELQEQRQQAQDKRAEDARAQEAQNQSRQNQIAQENVDISRGHLTLAQQQEARAANKPEFLSQADPKTPNLIRYNPQSGEVESMPNPNYDAAKEQADQLRQQLATQIQARQITLEEAKQQYQQWFDTNVKTPLALAQEARDKAAEQRAALDAEERRRQFASNFSLQKADLGQRAGAAAVQAEESLLPYRAGPNEAADMSSAINGLGAGGSMSANAASGIHFQPSDFEFNAPDFKSIARNAAKEALKGISSYIPSDQQYQTADYSSVPAVNASGAPSIPSGYGAFQGIIDNLNSHYQFGGGQSTAPATGQ